MIGIVGLGFVGLTTAVGFALKGHTVLGYDTDNEKLTSINNGSVPFYEQGFDQALAEVLNKKFRTVEQLQELTRECDVIFLCVGTPSTAEGADLSSLYNAIREVVDLLNRYAVIVIKSTVPPGTSKEITDLLTQEDVLVGQQVGLASNPEFLREGRALQDFIEPDRIVIGADDQKSGDLVQTLYKPFDAPVWRVSLTTAEFVKYLSNTFLSTLISFSNEMASFGEAVDDIDVKTAFDILHQDRRWFGNPAPMTSYAWPGCGFGGYCLPKDTYAMVKKGEALGMEMELLNAVLKRNSSRKIYVVDVLDKRLEGLKGKTIAVLGLAFKPDTDDVRDTPSAEIIKTLLERGANVIAYDPLAVENFRRCYDFNIEYVGSLAEAVKSSDGIFIATAWKEFQNIRDFSSDKVIVDGRYFLK